MQTTITLKEKSVYGRTLIYPACAQSEKLALLIGRQTLNNSELTIIKELGFEINLIKLPA
jgi:hypothetical protein